MSSDKIDRKNSIGVAFSGGGLQGIAHIGAVQALYELGIHPQYVSVQAQVRQWRQSLQWVVIPMK